MFAVLFICRNLTYPFCGSLEKSRKNRTRINFVPHGSQVSHTVTVSTYARCPMNQLLIIDFQLINRFFDSYRLFLISSIALVEPKVLPSRYLPGKADEIPRIWGQIRDKIDTQSSWPCKHFLNFFASKTVLRVIICCLRGVGSMSSSRRLPRFIVLFSPGHRWLFFVASPWACVVVASFLCLSVVGSSFRRLRYILDSGKSTSLGRYVV